MSLYLRFCLFLLPLVVTVIVQEVSVQWITGGLARLPMSVNTLASFGLAWGLSNFMTGPLVQSKQMSLVLVERKQSFRKALLFMLALTALVTCLQAMIATTGVGTALLLRLHRVSAATSQDVQTILLWLLAHPLLQGMTFFLAGPLIRNRQTRYVSFSSLGGFAAIAAAVAISLSIPSIRAQPILLPVLALYAGQSVELATVALGVWRHRKAIWSTRLHAASDTRDLTMGRILRFFWPLAAMIMVQEFTRPMINLVIARQTDGELWLAVLAAVYALGQWPYRWLNETRTIASSFQSEDPLFRASRRFNLAAAGVSLSISLLLFWTPLRHVILQNLMGLEAGFAALCIPPLMIFAAYSPVVGLRAYMHGVALVQRRTLAVLPSALGRFTSIVLSLFLLPQVGVAGAVLGVTTLLLGFISESLILTWLLRRKPSPSPGRASAT